MLQDDKFEKVSLEYQLIYADPADCRGPVDLGDQEELDNPIGEFLAKCVDELSLAKNGGVDSSWNEEIGTPARVQLSKTFLEQSDKRFERVAEKIRKFFGDHAEESAEAIELAKALRDDVRREFNAA